MIDLKANASVTGIGAGKPRRHDSISAGEADATYVLKTDGPLAATLNFPVIFLGKLPDYIPRGNFVGGILSGKLTISESLKQPHLQGDIHLINGKLATGSSITGATTFAGQTASIDFIRFVQKRRRFFRARGN